MAKTAQNLQKGMVIFMQNSELKSGIDIIGRFIKGSRFFFFSAVILSMLNTVINSLTPQIIRFTVDHVIDSLPYEENVPDFIVSIIDSLGGRDFFVANLAVMGALIVVASILAGVCNYLFRVCATSGSEGFIKRLRDYLFEHIQKLPLSWHVGHQTGEIIQRATSDVNVVRQFISVQMIDSFRTVFLILYAISIMFTMNVKLAFISLAFVPVVILYSSVFYSRLSKRYREADELEGELTATVQENLSGVRVVRAFGREAFEMDRFDKKNNIYSQAWIKLSYLMGVYWGVGDFLTGLGLQTLVITVFGSIEAVSGNISLGEYIAFLSYNSMLVWPMRSLGRMLSEMSKAGVSFSRIGYIINAERESDKPTAKPVAVKGDIVFENVSFGYENQTSGVIRDASFTIKAGSTFAILGGTGSGKSTLMHLLNRLYELPEKNGKISIGGTDIRDIELSHLRKNIGMVLQEPYLYSRTIKENIQAFRDDIVLDEVRNVARIACVDDSIVGFADGYDTIVGERGVTLSGGQKQRVAISRMLMQNTPIMVFDDSLSAVDSETDYKIRQALRENTSDATVIIISHRITTLMQADMIMVLNDGKVEQIGHHNELINSDGIYRDIYDIQLSGEDRALTEGGGDNE